MKKLTAILTVFMLATVIGSVSASAAVSPQVNGGSSSTVVDTTSGKDSPKTGVDSTNAVTAGLAVLACGGIATVAKKKMEKAN